MLVLAHRGFAAKYPENTLPAFESSLSQADGIEIDVRACADDLVAFHDSTVNRLTDQTGPLTEYTAAELAEIPIADSDATIPRVEDVLEVLPEDTVVTLEVKDQHTVPDLVDIVVDAPHDILVSATDATTLRAIDDHLPQLPRAYIIDRAADLREAVQLDCTYVHAATDLCQDASFVKKAHHRGLMVHAWTITDDETAEMMADVGVDGLISDIPLPQYIDDTADD